MVYFLMSSGLFLVYSECGEELEIEYLDDAHITCARDRRCSGNEMYQTKRSLLHWAGIDDCEPQDIVDWNFPPYNARKKIADYCRRIVCATSRLRVTAIHSISPACEHFEISKQAMDIILRPSRGWKSRMPLGLRSAMIADAFIFNRDGSKI